MSTPAPQLTLIGLTGGIGMGKTTVTNYLAKDYQIPILDADLYAREAVQPGTEILQRIRDRYGPEILLPNGQLNRLRLGERIFTQPAERQWLEQQIHPFVRLRFDQEIAYHQATRTHSLLVLSIPLLFEANLVDLVSEVWVVFCTPEQQVKRLQQANPALTLEQIQARIASQLPIQEKLARADRVFDNTATPRELYDALDQALLSLNLLKVSL